MTPLLTLTGAVTMTRPKRRGGWRRALATHGPLIPAALGLGLLAGSAIAVVTHADPAGGYCGDNKPYVTTPVPCGTPPNPTELFAASTMAMPTFFQINDQNATVMRIDLQAHTIWVNPKMKPNDAAKTMLRYLRTMHDWCPK